MKKRFYIPLWCAVLAMLAGCSPVANKSGRLRVSVGIAPVAYLTSRIGGGRIEVVTVLPEGRTPHDFNIRPKIARDVAQSKLLFCCGLPFEEQLAQFMKGRGKVYDISAGVRRIPFTDGRNGYHHHHGHNCSGHSGSDPHVWLSPSNLAVMADNITVALCETDPAGAEIYRKNCAALKAELAGIDREISAELKPFEKRTFFVYHPAFGYFADAYKLHQRAVELNGREASAVQQAAIIREATAAGAATVFVQKQFNPRTAEALAQKIGGNVVYLDPLEHDIIGNLRKISSALKAGFLRKK